MATLNGLEFVISAKDQASATLKKVGDATKEIDKGFKLLNPTLLGVGIGFTGMAMGVMKAVKAYAEFETQVFKLHNAISNMGITMKDYDKWVIQMAENMSLITVHSKEQILSSAALFTTWGLAGESLKKAEDAAANLAARMGGTLEDATVAITRALDGNMRGLKQYGIVLGNNVPAGERFAAVLQAIQMKFGGASGAEANTVAGAMKMATNALGELWEGFGQAVVKATPLLDITRQLTIALKEMAAASDAASGGGTASSRAEQKYLGLSEQLQKMEGSQTHTYGLFGGQKLDNKSLQELSKQVHEAYLEWQKTLGVEKESLKVAEEQAQKAKAKADALRAHYDWEVKNTAALKDQRDVYKDILNIQKSAGVTEEHKRAQADIQKAIDAGNLELVQAEAKNIEKKVFLFAQQREALLDEAKVLDGSQMANVERMKNIKADLDLIDKQLAASDEELQKMTEGAQKIIDAKMTAATGMISAAGSGNLSTMVSGAGAGLTAFGGASMASAGPIGAIVAAIMELIKNFGKMPQMIAESLGGLVQGLIDGFPKLMNYIAGDFISDLMTKFIPALIRAIVQFFPMMIAMIVKAVFTIIKSIPSMVWNIVKSVGTMFWDGFKAIGNWFKNLFGGGPTEAEKWGAGMKALEGVIKELTKALKDASNSIIDSLLSPAQLAGTGQGKYAQAQWFRETKIAELQAMGGDFDSEKAKKLLEEINQLAIDMMNYQKMGYDAEIMRLDEIEKLATEKYNEERKAITEMISKLKDWKQTAVDAFRAAREAILGKSMSADQNVARLGAAFYGANSPEAKSAAAGPFASALQSQYDAYAALAAQGAITGEEFAKHQAEILDQLGTAESQTVTYYDKLISIQQQQLDSLDSNFKTLIASIDKQRAEAKELLIAVVERLDDQLQYWSTKWGWGISYQDPSWSWNQTAYKQNTNNQRGYQRAA